VAAGAKTHELRGIIQIGLRVIVRALQLCQIDERFARGGLSRERMQGHGDFPK
jgi:hypothetical protein